MLEMAFVSIVMVTIGFVLCEAYINFKNDIKKHLTEKELMVTFDEEKAKVIELKTKK